MSPRPLFSSCLALVLLAVSLPACTDFGDPVVAMIGGQPLTIEDVRRAYADLPVQKRPSFTSPEDRARFVADVIDRRILLDLGAELQDESAPDFQGRLRRARRVATTNRFRVLLAGQQPIEPSEVEESLRRMQVQHRIERLLVHTLEGARAAREAAESGVSFVELAQSGQGFAVQEEWIQWTPDAVQPAADVVDSLEVGEVSQPLRRGLIHELIRVIERRPDPSADLVDPAELRAQIRRGLRTRHQSRVVQDFVAAESVRVGLTLDPATIEVLAQRTMRSILEDRLTEHDSGWALPALTEEQGALTVATWGKGRRWTAADYRTALQMRIPTQRPSGPFLESRVHRACEAELAEVLLFEEAVRRRIDEDWWVERIVRTARENALLERARQEIVSGVEVTSAEADTLAAMLQQTRSDVFRVGAIAQVIRFDFPTRELAVRERQHVERAGGALARLAEVLAGDPSFFGSYHVINLSPNGVSDPILEEAVFGSATGALQGPVEVLGNWSLVERLSLERPRVMTEEEIRERVSEQMRRSQFAGVISGWIESRREELQVAIDEDAVDNLAPGI